VHSDLIEGMAPRAAPVLLFRAEPCSAQRAPRQVFPGRQTVQLELTPTSAVHFVFLVDGADRFHAIASPRVELLRR
jgi:hypothetical protein